MQNKETSFFYGGEKLFSADVCLLSICRLYIYFFSMNCSNISKTSFAQYLPFEMLPWKRVS